MAAESKHVVKFRALHLKPGEAIVSTCAGYIGEMMGSGKNQQHNGVLIVTGQRVAFYRKGLFGEVLETIPLKTITSIERKSFMGHRVVTLHTSHDGLAFKTHEKEGEASVVAAIESGRAAEAAPPAPAVVAPDDAAATLKKLADLRDAGVLTDEEFSLKKSEILARI